MPKKSNKPIYNFQNSHFMQISESHCGPAVIQMLLSNLGVEVTQEAVAEAGGAKDLIELNGMRVDQLALAVHLLAPETQFWSKEHSKLSELVKLLNTHRVPVGVEWQGLFEDEDEEEVEEEAETGDEDYGHYSVVTYASRRNKQLIIVDPYKDYIGQDRVFSFKEFKQRWWDYNEVPDPLTGEARLVEDYHMMFIITRQGALFPLELGMQKGS
jgi:hypothetical protein